MLELRPALAYWTVRMHRNVCYHRGVQICLKIPAIDLPVILFLRYLTALHVLPRLYTAG